MANREAQRRHRVRKKAQRAAAQVVAFPVPDDPIGALVNWSRSTLRVPPGHPLAGQPLSLPDYGEAFLRDALRARESLLCLGRKNAKSAIVAVYLLGGNYILDSTRPVKPPAAELLAGRGAFGVGLRHGCKST
jgi:acetyl esterase/lipase